MEVMAHHLTLTVKYGQRIRLWVTNPALETSFLLTSSHHSVCGALAGPRSVEYKLDSNVCFVDTLVKWNQWKGLLTQFHLSR